jgi:hypothetical protein
MTIEGERDNNLSVVDILDCILTWEQKNVFM